MADGEESRGEIYTRSAVTSLDVYYLDMAAYMSTLEHWPLAGSHRSKFAPRGGGTSLHKTSVPGGGRRRLACAGGWISIGLRCKMGGPPSSYRARWPTNNRRAKDHPVTKPIFARRLMQPMPRRQSTGTPAGYPKKGRRRVGSAPFIVLTADRMPPRCTTQEADDGSASKVRRGGRRAA